MKRTALVLSISAVAVCLAVSIAYGQAPKPGQEQMKLAVLLGSWTLEGDLKAGIFGPPGKITGVERYEWLPGGFFLQMNREARGPAAAFRHIIIFGYDPTSKRHTGQFFDFTEGGSTSATIAITGNTWNWSGTGHTGNGKSFQERCTVTFSSGGGSFTVRCEVAADGKTWSPSYEGRYTKTK